MADPFPGSPEIFISYRRADAKELVGWLSECLERHLGAGRLFQDVDSLRLGEDFAQEIEAAVCSCAVVLAVIGPRWLAILDERRDDPRDYVRLEIETAFARGVTVIPVLVGGARMPGEDALPSSLAPLARRHAAELHPDRFRSDVDRLIRQLDKVLERHRRTGAPLDADISTQYAPAASAVDIPASGQSDAPLAPMWLPPRPAAVVGREQMLEQMHEQLTAADQAVPRVVTLHGIGGAGKTTLAVEYAYRHLAEMSMVWHFPAEEPVMLASEFSRLAGLLGVRGLAEGSDPVAAVHAALAARSVPWLLIFDNARDAESVASFLPPSGAGKVVITSQSPYWQVGQAVEVPVLDAHTAAAFLMSRSAEQDQDAAADLAAELGRLPLALEQAAAYIVATGSTLENYLDLFRSRRKDLLARGGARRYGKTVATTWSLAFTQLYGHSPPAAALLQFLACCAPEPVPLGLLLRSPPGSDAQLPPDLAPPLRPLLEDSLIANDAIADLRAFSLITFAGQGCVLMHRLVQAVTQDRMPADQVAAWRQAAGELIEVALPADPSSPPAWPAFASLLPHARALLSSHSSGRARAANYVGHCGDYSAARDQSAALLRARERALGSGSPDTLTTRHDLACWTGMAGNPAGARDQLAALIPDAERALGTEHPDTLTARHDAAYWTGRAGAAAEARDLFATLLPVREKILGPEHPDTLMTRSSLVSWIGQAADPSAAARDQLIATPPASPQGYGQRALDMNGSQAQPARWPGQATGPAAAARDQLLLLLPIRERVLGPDDPKTLLTRHELARWTGEAGDPAAARDQLTALQPLREAVLGPDHPDTLVTRSYLARWTGLAGDPVGARDQLADLLPGRERVLGPLHPDTLVTRHNLAHWTGQTGDPAGARDQLADLLPIRERVLGPLHPDTLVTRHNLAHWTALTGDPAASCDQLAELLPDAEQILGISHPVTIAIRNSQSRWQHSEPQVTQHYTRPAAQLGQSDTDEMEASPPSANTGTTTNAPVAFARQVKPASAS
jgi:hypothetical protein